MSARHSSQVDEMSAQLAHLAPLEGANSGSWPGLVIYRFSGPAPWSRKPVHSISLVMAIQGHHELTVDRSVLSPSLYQCLVFGGHLQVDGEALEASVGRPYLAVVLELDPGLVRHVDSDIIEWQTRGSRVSHRSPRPSSRRCAYQLLEVLIRAGSSISTDLDRHLLAPGYQREIVYGLLRSEHGHQLRDLVSTDPAHSLVTTVTEFTQAHLAESLSVSDMAAQANMSTSAFAHRFRDVAGRPPYQFLKEMRLDRARELLSDGDTPVAQVSRAVGYASVSQFIKAFRTRFGMTPLAYQGAHAEVAKFPPPR